MLGEYGGRSMITVERIAQNLNDSARYRVADNNGRVLETTSPTPTVPWRTGRPSRCARWSWRCARPTADISDAPGTLMCNHLMYGVLRYVATHDLPPRVGWIHLPHLPEVAALDINLGAPSMSLETSTTGVRAPSPQAGARQRRPRPRPLPAADLSEAGASVAWPQYSAERPAKRVRRRAEPRSDQGLPGPPSRVIAIESLIG